MTDSAVSQPAVEGIAEAARDGARAGEGLLPEIGEFLRVSELMLLDLLSGRPPEPAYAGKGHPEFGWVLYYLHDPPAALANAFAAGSPAEAAWKRLARGPKPQTTVTRDHLAPWLGAPGQGSPRGECVMPGYHEGPDAAGRSLLALVDVFAAGRKRHDFGSTPCLGALRGGAGKVRLGLVADGGAVVEGSASVSSAVRQMLGLGCDYLFRLGSAYGADVAGAGQGEYPAAGYAAELDSGRMFALNSGRAMCSGGHEYFGRVLGSSMFKHQNQTSYFALSYGAWVILGLDTAYHAPAGSLHAMGVLGEQQSKWIREYRRSAGGFDGRKILVLTHHEGQDAQGAMLSALHEELAGALGRPPDVWYWGFGPGAIAYSNASAAGRRGIRARNLGSSPLAREVMRGLRDAAGEPIGAVDHFIAPARALNGFAVLELSESGGIAEKFYEPGRASAVWQSVNGIRFA